MSISNVTEAQFRRLIFRSIVLPVVLLLVMAGGLVWQIGHLLDAARWVEHSDQVLSQANRLEKLHIDLETGVRGYVITGNETFLEPYEHAQRVIPDLEKSTVELVSDRVSQQELLEHIREVRGKWLDLAEKRITARRTGGDTQPIEEAKQGKTMMDEIRATFAQFITVEEELRAVRDHDARAMVRRGLITICILAVLIGVTLAVMSKRQLEALSKTYNEALKTADELTGTLEKRVEERTQELAAANASMESANLALGELNKELEAFAYSISHDLRAPMRHITGFSDLLRKSLGAKLSTDEAENLDTIHTTARLAGRMVDDLLGFSRVGRVQLQRAPVDMGKLVAECRKELGLEVAEREIEWKVGELPTVRGDGALLKLVVQNLLSNAVKYTAKAGHAAIEVRGVQKDGGVEYVVRDNGVGFDMEYVDKLFGVFQRLHRAEEFEGTGIGLANVRRIILRHGGRVWAEGAIGQGASFYFWLPN